MANQPPIGNVTFRFHYYEKFVLKNILALCHLFSKNVQGYTRSLPYRNGLFSLLSCHSLFLKSGIALVVLYFVTQFLCFTETPSKSRVYKEEPALEVTEQIEELRAVILEKLDIMNDLRSKLRKEFVPSTVCTHLEQCIKETEVSFY